MRRPAVGRTPSAAAERLGAALAEPGCPVCRCLEADARRNLAAFLREQTMDPAGRAALRRAGGFCAWHTGLLRDAADGILSVALLAEDLIGAPLAAVRCPACAGLRGSVAAYLEALLDPAVLPALARSPALPCRPHLRLLRGAARRDRRLPPLEQAVAERVARLRAELAGFIAKQDYRARERPTAEEAGAWGRALEHLAGRAKLFGSDLPRV